MVISSPIRPEALEIARQLLVNNDMLVNGHADKLVRHLTYSEHIPPEQTYRFKKLVKLGINAKTVKGKVRRSFNGLEELIPQSFNDLIALFN